MKEKPYKLCFETLSNDLRLRILQALGKRPRSVQELARDLQAEQSRLSHSLSMLRTCHYVTAKQNGKKRIYALAPNVKEGLHLKQDKTNLFTYLDLHIALCCNNHCHKMQVR